jgi:hypothetical protein
MNIYMKIILAIKSGFSRSLRVWKGILIFWVISFLTVSLLVIPLRASLKSALGDSMITEKLVKGINIDVLGDLGSNLHSMISSLSAGIIMISLAAVLINIFITGGLFDSVKNGSVKFLSENFFKASAKNFWPFMIITFMLYLIILVLTILVVVIPVTLASNSESAPEGMAFRILVVCLSLFMLAMSAILLVADYARAWQTSQNQNDGFKALGFGFSQTFRTFFSSFPLILIMLVLQAVVVWFVAKVIAGIIPSKGMGVIMLFFISQLLFFLKLFLKVLRYGSVTSLMEQNPPGTLSDTENPLMSYAEPSDMNIGFNPDIDNLI